MHFLFLAFMIAGLVLPNPAAYAQVHRVNCLEPTIIFSVDVSESNDAHENWVNLVHTLVTLSSKIEELPENLKKELRPHYGIIFFGEKARKYKKFTSSLKELLAAARYALNRNFESASTDGREAALLAHGMFLDMRKDKPHAKDIIVSFTDGNWFGPYFSYSDYFRILRDLTEQHPRRNLLGFKNSSAYDPYFRQVAIDGVYTKADLLAQAIVDLFICV